MSLGVWADITDVPNRVCHDARARDWEGQLTGASTNRGQAGWDMGMTFRNLADLCRQLTAGARLPDWVVDRQLNDVCSATDRFLQTRLWVTPSSPLLQSCDAEAPANRIVQPGAITRLALNVHGQLGGELKVNGETTSGVSAATFPTFRRAFATLFSYTSDSSTILFMSCLAGRGQGGTELLRAFSTAWPRRTFVAFTTIGAQVGQMRRPGELCTNAGMRDTNNIYQGEVRDYTTEPAGVDASGRQRSLWDVLPWASETSPHAKVMRGGVLLRGEGT